MWWLGASQCVYWGLLYYGFAVLLLPMQAGLGLHRTGVAGAFSVGLLLAALSAPRIGRWLDAGHAAAVFRAGAALAVAGLASLALARGVVGLVLGWSLVGLAMAGLLYEAAFALVGRAFDDAGERLRALAAVTVSGGLASTVFLPLVAWVVDSVGWRGALLLFAASVVAMAVLLERKVLPVLSRPVAVPEPPSAGVACRKVPLAARVVFPLATFAAAGLTTLLVPLLVQRGQAPFAAASALAGFGLAQLPGRLWLLGGRRRMSLPLLVWWPLVLQSAGLAIVAVSAGLVAAALGVAVFGLGAGLHTLARPWLLQGLAGPALSGRWNGEVARLQGFARAVGPVLVVAAAATLGMPVVLVVVALLLLASVPAARSLASAARRP